MSSSPPNVFQVSLPGHNVLQYWTRSQDFFKCLFMCFHLLFLPAALLGPGDWLTSAVVFKSSAQAELQCGLLIGTHDRIHALLHVGECKKKKIILG
jgi:hypothetical protein